MPEMVTCPAEGCDYGPKAKTAVAGHYGGKTDDSHAGGYQAAMAAIESEETRAGAGSEGRDPSGDLPTPDDDQDDGCPECGETDWFDPRDHGVDADRGCPSCSTAEEWVVYDV